MTSPGEAGWVAVDCIIADVLVRGTTKSERPVRVLASQTNLSGFPSGDPLIFTEWGLERVDGSHVPILREWRYPHPEGPPQKDRKPCVHEVPGPKEPT